MEHNANMVGAKMQKAKRYAKKKKKNSFFGHFAKGDQNHH